VKHIDLNVNTHLPWNMPRYMRRLKALVKAEKPDIVDSLCSKELTRLHELKGLCKVVMGEFHFSHDTYVIKGQLRKLRAYEKAVAELDCFVVLTREDEKAWAPYCSRLEQIYNPADGTPGERAPLEAKRCISGGRFEKQKNYDDMVRVWKIVRQRHPDWTLDLYGNGKKKARTEALIRREGLEGSIVVHPATPRIKEEMMASSMYLMTSLFEGFPMVLVETAAIGLPCVCMTCPCGPAEFIEDGVSGMLAAPGDSRHHGRQGLHPHRAAGAETTDGRGNPQKSRGFHPGPDSAAMGPPVQAPSSRRMSGASSRRKGYSSNSERS
jgi:Glycosyltransferase